MDVLERSKRAPSATTTGERGERERSEPDTDVTERPTVSSRIAGFHREPLDARRERIVGLGVLSDDAARHLASGGALPEAIADAMTENVIAIHGLPLSVALNFRGDHTRLFDRHRHDLLVVLLVGALGEALDPPIGVLLPQVT